MHEWMNEWNDLTWNYIKMKLLLNINLTWHEDVNEHDKMCNGNGMTWKRLVMIHKLYGMIWIQWMSDPEKKSQTKKTRTDMKWSQIKRDAMNDMKRQMKLHGVRLT